MTKKRDEEKQNEFCCDNSTGIQTKYETKLRLVLVTLVLPFLLFCEQRQLYPHLLQLLDQLPALVHLEEDVASAHELPLQVDLRDGLPVRELLHALGVCRSSVIAAQCKLLFFFIPGARFLAYTIPHGPFRGGGTLDAH